MISRQALRWIAVGCLALPLGVGCATDPQPTHRAASHPVTTPGVDDIQADRPPEPKTLFALARMLAAQGKLDEARFTLNRIVEQSPDYTPAYVELAELHLRANRPADAREALNLALQHQPDDPVLLNDLGMSYFIEGNYPKAADLFADAASRSDDIAYRANEAAAIGMAGQIERAAELYATILPPKDVEHNLYILTEARRRAQDPLAATNTMPLSEIDPMPNAGNQPEQP